MNTFLTRILTTLAKSILLTLVAARCGEMTSAATYNVGDVVTNFSFIARQEFTRSDGTVVPSGAPVYLHDFAGRIVFLEWFAVWCPYCVAAAPQVETGIVDWYASRGGNPNGVPVLHVAVNQEPAVFYQKQTDSFVTRQGFGVVVNDYDSKQINPVRFMFQSSGQPIFVVINGVTNSPTHKSWECLVNYLGYGQTDFDMTLGTFRAVIDTVQAGVSAPALSGPRWVGSEFEFSIQTQLGQSYRVQTSTNASEWTTLSTISGSTNATVFRASNGSQSQNFYRVATP